MKPDEIKKRVTIKCFVTYSWEQEFKGTQMAIDNEKDNMRANVDRHIKMLNALPDNVEVIEVE